MRIEEEQRTSVLEHRSHDSRSNCVHYDKSSPLARLPATALIPLPTLCELISHLFVLSIFSSISMMSNRMQE